MFKVYKVTQVHLDFIYRPEIITYIEILVLSQVCLLEKKSFEYHETN